MEGNAEEESNVGIDENPAHVVTTVHDVRDAFDSPEITKKQHLRPATTSKLPVSTRQNGGSLRTSSGSTPKRMRSSDVKKPPTSKSVKSDDDSKQTPGSDGVEKLNAAERLYLGASDQKARLIDLRSKIPEGCTFQPDTSISRSTLLKSHETANEIPVARRLYEEAATRKNKQIDLATKPPAGCSFKPTLVTQSTSSNEWLHEAHTPLKEGRGSRPDTPTRLYESAKLHNQKLEEKRRKIEEDRLAECTFKPMLRTSSRGKLRPESPSVQSASRSTEPVDSSTNTDADKQMDSVSKKEPSSARYDKLYQDAEILKAKRYAKAQEIAREQEMKLQREKEVMVVGGISSAALKKVPTIEITSNFEDRLVSSDAKMKNRMQAHREAAALRESQECPFQPSLHTRPASANRGRSTSRGRDSSGGDTGDGGGGRGAGRSSTPVHQRLLEEAEESKKRKEQLRKRQEAVDMQQLTFRPTLVASSKRRVASVSKQSSHTNQDGDDAVDDSEAPVVEVVADSPPSTPLKTNTTSSTGAGAGTSSGTAVYVRLQESGKEYETRRQIAQKRIEAEQMAGITFQPQLIRSPMSAKYDDCVIKPPSVITPTGQESPSTVFDRLQYAAMLQKKAKEALIMNASKEYSFQPELNKRAKSAPKRRTKEETDIPVHDRLIKAGERRKSMLIDLKNSRIDAELAGCTFAPTLNKESEAIVLHMIAEDNNDNDDGGGGGESGNGSSRPVPLLHQTPPSRRQSNFVSPTRRQSATYVAFGLSITDPRMSATDAAAIWNTGARNESVGSSSPNHTIDQSVEDTEGGPESKSLSAPRASSRTRRGSVFDRLNVPKTPVLSLDMSPDDDMVSLSNSQHSNMSPNRLISSGAAGQLSSTPTSPVPVTKKPAPIRRTSMLLKPTLASALKDKHEDHEAIVRVAASLIGLELSDHKPKLNESFAKKIDEEYSTAAVASASPGSGGVETTVTSKPRRRDSVLLPTASSAMKAVTETTSSYSTHPPGKHLPIGKNTAESSKKVNSSNTSTQDDFEHRKVIKRKPKVGTEDVSQVLPPPPSASSDGSRVLPPAPPSPTSDNDITAIITAAIASATAAGVSPDDMQAVVTAAVKAAMTAGQSSPLQHQSHSDSHDKEKEVDTEETEVNRESSGRNPPVLIMRKMSSIGMLFGSIEEEEDNNDTSYRGDDAGEGDTATARVIEQSAADGEGNNDTQEISEDQQRELWEQIFQARSDGVLTSKEDVLIDKEEEDGVLTSKEDVLIDKEEEDGVLTSKEDVLIDKEEEDASHSQDGNQQRGVEDEFVVSSLSVAETESTELDEKEELSEKTSISNYYSADNGGPVENMSSSSPTRNLPLNTDYHQDAIQPLSPPSILSTELSTAGPRTDFSQPLASPSASASASPQPINTPKSLSKSSSSSSVSSVGEPSSGVSAAMAAMAALKMSIRTPSPALQDPANGSAVTVHTPTIPTIPMLTTNEAKKDPIDTTTGATDTTDVVGGIVNGSSDSIFVGDNDTHLSECGRDPNQTADEQNTSTAPTSGQYSAADVDTEGLLPSHSSEEHPIESSEFDMKKDSQLPDKSIAHSAAAADDDDDDDDDDDEMGSKLESVDGDASQQRGNKPYENVSNASGAVVSSESITHSGDVQTPALPVSVTCDGDSVSSVANLDYCGHCGSTHHKQGSKHKLQLCGTCHRVAYCSRECQVAHWKDGHKKTCELSSASTHHVTPATNPNSESVTDVVTEPMISPSPLTTSSPVDYTVLNSVIGSGVKMTGTDGRSYATVAKGSIDGAKSSQRNVEPETLSLSGSDLTASVSGGGGIVNWLQEEFASEDEDEGQHSEDEDEDEYVLS